MKMKQLRVKLNIQGPILTQATTIGHYGYDAYIARNHHGNPYIAGTHLAGKLRQAWQELLSVVDPEYFPPEMTDWLGGESQNGFEPLRKRLLFSDFECGEVRHVAKTRHRIMINQLSLATESGSLQMMESPFDSGEQVEFIGTVSFFPKSLQEADLIAEVLDIGLKWIPQIGSQRTIGFGRLKKVCIKDQAIKPVFEMDSVGLVPDNGIVPLWLQPQSPFCFAERRSDDNLFESSETIPGAAIKGALANCWLEQIGQPHNAAIHDSMDTDRPLLGQYFNQLRFTHAFPSQQQQCRPVQQPLSFVQSKCGKLSDVALCEKPVLIDGEAPAFNTDWKGGGNKTADQHCGQFRLNRELRVRNKMSEQTRRTEDEKLFAYDMVIPDDVHWLGNLDLSDVPKQSRECLLRQLLSLVTDGLPFLGKTKTRALLKPLAKNQYFQSQQASRFEPIANEQWIVCLQTDTLLCNPSDLDESSGTKELHQAYQQAWSEISDHQLKLCRYFAKQKLAGGEYLANRFKTTAAGGYFPYLLTAAGSVFVLQAEDGVDVEALTNKFQNWYLSGLPLSVGVKKYYGLVGKDHDLWQQCPYIRHNGYGEIVVNMSIHQELHASSERPDVSEVEDLWTAKKGDGGDV